MLPGGGSKLLGKAVNKGQSLASLMGSGTVLVEGMQRVVHALVMGQVVTAKDIEKLTEKGKRAGKGSLMEWLAGEEEKETGKEAKLCKS